MTKHGSGSSIRVLATLASALSAALLAPSAPAQSPPIVWSRSLPHRPSSLEVSATGRLLAVGLGRGPSQPPSGSTSEGVGGYELLSPSSGSLLVTAYPWRSPPNHVALSPSATRLGVAVGDAEIRRARDASLLFTAYGSGSGSAHEAAYSADGSRLFVGTTPGSGPAVHVFDASNGQLTNSFGLVNFVTAMAVSRDGRRLAAATDARIVLVFDVTNPDQEQLVRLFDDPNPLDPADPYGSTSTVYGLALTADGRILATMSDQRVKLWRIADGASLGVFESPQSFPEPFCGEFFTSVALSADGSRLAAGGFESCPTRGTLNVWDTASGQSVGHYRDDTGETVTAVAFGPSGTRLHYAAFVPPLGGLVAAAATP